MNPTDFKGSSSGKLVTTQIYLTPYQAFVPNPLPPTLLFEPETIKLLEQAARALGELAGLGRMLPNPKLLIRPFISREAVLSSMIEGTVTELQDLYASEATDQPLPGLGASQPPSDDLREVQNYVKAMEYGLDQIQGRTIDIPLLCTLHERLMKGVRGDRANPGFLRERQNYIGPIQDPAEATYIPPPVPEMRQSLVELEGYIQHRNSYPELVRLALIHYQFEAIHPFEDGNGRIGRLLTSLLLVSWHLLPAPLLYLSAFFEKNRQYYYDLLLNVSRRGAWNEWVNFFLKGVENQARDAVKRANRLQDLRDRWQQELIRKDEPARLLELVDRLFASPYQTVSTAQAFLNVTNRTARLYINRLVEDGILTSVGSGKYARVFSAEAILKALQEELN